MNIYQSLAAGLILGAVAGCEHNGPSQYPDPMGNPDPNLRHQPMNSTSSDAASGGPAAAPTADPLNRMGTSQQNGGISSDGQR